MSCPRLPLAATPVLLLLTVATSMPALSSPARAQSHDAAPVKLALLAPPAPRKVALVDMPRTTTTTPDKAPAKSAGGTTWWPWALVAAGAAGVAAVVFLASGRDPACPAGRVCQ